MKLVFRRDKVGYLAWIGLISYLIGGFYSIWFWAYAPIWLLTILKIKKREEE